MHMHMHMHMHVQGRRVTVRPARSDGWIVSSHSGHTRLHTSARDSVAGMPPG